MPFKFLLKFSLIDVNRCKKWYKCNLNVEHPQRNTRDKVNVGIRQPYFRIVGVKVDTEGSGRSVPTLTATEEDDFRRLASSPNIYETLAKSIAPSIYGSIDIKKAITCLLFGGSRKRYSCLFFMS